MQIFRNALLRRSVYHTVSSIRTKWDAFQVYLKESLSMKWEENVPDLV
jgi:hypothetical protein